MCVAAGVTALTMRWRILWRRIVTLPWPVVGIIGGLFCENVAYKPTWRAWLVAR